VWIRSSIGTMAWVGGFPYLIFPGALGRFKGGVSFPVYFANMGYNGVHWEHCPGCGNGKGGSSIFEGPQGSTGF